MNLASNFGTKQHNLMLVKTKNRNKHEGGTTTPGDVQLRQLTFLKTSFNLLKLRNSNINKLVLSAILVNSAQNTEVDE